MENKELEQKLQSMILDLNDIDFYKLMNELTNDSIRPIYFGYITSMSSDVSPEVLIDFLGLPVQYDEQCEYYVLDCDNMYLKTFDKSEKYYNTIISLLYDLLETEDDNEIYSLLSKHDLFTSPDTAISQSKQRLLTEQLKQGVKNYLYAYYDDNSLFKLCLEYIKKSDISCELGTIDQLLTNSICFETINTDLLSDKDGARHWIICFDNNDKYYLWMWDEDGVNELKTFSSLCNEINTISDIIINSIELDIEDILELYVNLRKYNKDNKVNLDVRFYKKALELLNADVWTLPDKTPYTSVIWLVEALYKSVKPLDYLCDRIADARFEAILSNGDKVLINTNPLVKLQIALSITTSDIEKLEVEAEKEANKTND